MGSAKVQLQVSRLKFKIPTLVENTSTSTMHEHQTRV